MTALLTDADVLPGDILFFSKYRFSNTGNCEGAHYAIALEAAKQARLAGHAGFVGCFFTSNGELDGCTPMANDYPPLRANRSHVALSSFQEIPFKVFEAEVQRELSMRKHGHMSDTDKRAIADLKEDFGKHYVEESILLRAAMSCLDFWLVLS